MENNESANDLDMIDEKQLKKYLLIHLGEKELSESELESRLLACPMDEHPSDPCDAQPEEEDIALAAWRVEEATTLCISRLASKWAGLRSFSPDRLPVCGFDPAAPGFFWLAGQGGFGLQTSPAMALAAEALVTRGEWPEELRSVGVEPRMMAPDRQKAGNH